MSTTTTTNPADVEHLARLAGELLALLRRMGVELNDPDLRAAARVVLDFITAHAEARAQ